MKTIYELKRFHSSNSPDISKALKLYSENIEPSNRTDTNELLYWLDNYNRSFEDSFYILGLYQNDILMGFAQMAFFKKERFLEIDYLVIDKPYRKNNSFYVFLDKIEEFVAKENILYDNIVCEVGFNFENDEPSENAKILMRLLKMAHFGIIKCAYYIPRLGLTNYESQMRAVLMIFSQEEKKSIHKETYMAIVHTLFYKYYQRWYKVFFTEAEYSQYSQSLDILYDQIKKDVMGRKIIEINGYQNLLPLITIDLNDYKSKKGIKIISFIILFLLTLTVFGATTLFIQNQFKIDISNQATLFILSVFLASILTSILFNKKSDLLTKLIEKLIDKL